MSSPTLTEIQQEHAFDLESCRHTLNGTTSVLHCHHYATLYSQLADDCGMLDGGKLLAECAEDTFYQELSSYFRKHEVFDLSDRIGLAENLYSACGLGKMKTTCAGSDSGEVELEHSHVDEGWIKKWGQRTRPVNFITQGFIAGMFDAVFGRATRSYCVSEVASIVSGSERSRFTVVLK